MANTLGLDPSSTTYCEAFGLNLFHCKMEIVILPTSYRCEDWDNVYYLEQCLASGELRDCLCNNS